MHPQSLDLVEMALAPAVAELVRLFLVGAIMLSAAATAALAMAVVVKVVAASRERSVRSDPDVRRSPTSRVLVLSTVNGRVRAGVRRARVQAPSAPPHPS